MNRNMSFSGAHVACCLYMWSFGKLVVNPVHFLLTEKSKGVIMGSLFIPTLLKILPFHWLQSALFNNCIPLLEIT